MNVTLLFTALIGAILVLLLLVRQLRTKSWLEKGVIAEDSFPTLAPKRVGLFVFLAVVTSLFLLFMIIYNERAEFPDWRPIADSRLLWFNTALLVIGSVALQLARNAATHRRLTGIRINLTAAGMFHDRFSHRPDLCVAAADSRGPFHGNQPG